MSDQFDVVARMQFNRRCVRPIDLEVVGFYFQRMDARTVCVNTQREFVAECRFHRDIEIKGSASAQVDIVNSAGERGERGMGRTLAYAICSLR